ncbi:MAG: lysophospholipid acyltransferase family protein [Oscillospiraceae bacterium]|nr:lysophospholipid acyltransferase family protein [Oscillospiraceae bacterium]
MTEDNKRTKRLLATREKLHRKPLLSRNPLWRFCQVVLYYGIIIPVLKVSLPPILGLKLENRKAFRQLKEKGFVVVSNHVHPMDCTFIGLAVCPRRLIFTSQEETFYVRGLGLLLKLLNCVPVLTGVHGLRKFLDTMEEELKQGKAVVVYPESEIELICDHLRKFSDGAFTMAVRADVPVVPLVVTPREPKGLWKLTRREYCLTLTVGEPIYAEAQESEKRTIHQLRDTTRSAMEQMLAQGGHAYPKEKPDTEGAFWQVKKSKDLTK